MKIFSNFDTNRKQEAYQEAIEKFWKESVLVLNKSLLFFFSKVVFPLLWWTVVFVLLQFPIYFSLGEFWVAKYLVTILLFFIYLFMLSPIFKYYLDYMMDFSLVTPEFLTRYNQSWMLKRDIKSSYVKNIKTITIEKIRYDIIFSIMETWFFFLSEIGIMMERLCFIIFRIQSRRKRKL